jgi:hypothetical protein
MFLHVGAAGVMFKGFTSLSGLAMGKVITPQVGVLLLSYPCVIHADVIVRR